MILTDDYFAKQTFGKERSVLYLATAMPNQKIDKKELIKCALSVFKEKGYHKTSMSDIAEACDILKGSIYHYVSGKEELMVEVLFALKEHYAKKVFSMAYDDEFDPEDRLSMLATKAEEIFLDAKTGNFFVNIGLETKNTVPAFQSVIAHFFAEWIEALAHLFKYKISDKEARLHAEVVVAEVEGAAMLTQLLDDDQYLKRTNKKIVEVFNKWPLKA